MSPTSETLRNEDENMLLCSNANTVSLYCLKKLVFQPESQVCHEKISLGPKCRHEAPNPPLSGGTKGKQKTHRWRKNSARK